MVIHLFCGPKQLVKLPSGPFQSVQGSAIQHGSVAAGKEIVIEGLSISRIPQLDGPIPDPYDEMLSTPNVCFGLSSDNVFGFNENLQYAFIA